MANRVYGYQGYKGYQFETSPKKLQPEYEPEQKSETKKVNKSAKKKSNKQESQKSKQTVKISKEELNRKAKLVCYILFGFTVLFTISYRNSIINEKFNQKESLKSELAEIQKVNEQIEVGIENQLNLTSVEQLAKEKLGMNKLNNSQKVYINLPKKEYVEAKSESLIKVNNQNTFSDIVNNIKQFFNIN
ncbi:MAG: hypothetical protein IKE01_05855 [Clostridia bacterium]|nr:hypothetical protein [Clostridia bacterium]